MSGFRRILHATDFSAASGAAFRRAVALARASRAQLTIVHVHTPVLPMMPESYAVPRVYDTMVAEVRVAAQRHLDRLVTSARRAGARATGLLVEGVPHDRIARAARSTRADLLVLGTHGHTGLRRLALGSVAARVLALVPCPVLTVRGAPRRPPRA